MNIQGHEHAYRSHRVPRDDADAVKSNRKATERGNANAQNDLGVAYAKGLGISENDVEALKWYRKAAEQGAKTKLNNSDTSD